MGLFDNIFNGPLRRHKLKLSKALHTNGRQHVFIHTDTIREEGGKLYAETVTGREIEILRPSPMEELMTELQQKIINIAQAAYVDASVFPASDKDINDGNTGDGLAVFIARELREVTNEEENEVEAFNSAISAIETAAHEMDSVLSALYKAAADLDDEEPK